MFKILFVCTGNTCRSPMAAALLADIAEKAGMAGRISIASAGLAAGRQPASAQARSVMRQAGLNVDNHCSQQLTLQLLTAADVILTMTAAHKQALVGMAAGLEGKLYTLAEFAGETRDVSDPFGGSEAVYRECAGQIRQLLTQAWGKIVSLAGKK
ncbi:MULTISPECIES: low molecular weight protein arginine phosphatase [Sporomusa]|uniref:low molecular weight protein arginine phosphatase n=1 Tax=Sporomusa TaxID=2375 RepID=UPI001667A2C6|nr:low molecular weight protein arginine phosphatase [Sporomusa sp. GT1]